MSKMSRNKGAKGEREVCRILQARGYDAKRTFAQIGGDRADIVSIPGYAIEVKRTERLALWAALDQARDAAADHETPVLAFRRNRSEWHVAIPLEKFIDMLEAA